jgi:predicted metal-binding protein
MVECVKSFSEVKILYENWIKVFGVNCPMCRSPIVVRLVSVSSIASENGIIDIETEQICQNPECNYNTIKFYDFQIHE